MSILQMVFWGAACGVIGCYALYPLILLMCRTRARTSVSGGAPRHVTLVISAFNEEAVIRQKIENSLALDYPPHLLEIMIISDASDDSTDDIVREYADQRVVLYRQPERAGKSAGLSRFVPRAIGEVVVFSDANSMYAHDAISKLVRHFADPNVGFAVGHQRYRESENAAAESESLYWRYETWIKVQESRLGIAVCGDGAIFAIRSELFCPLLDDDINDFVIPLRIVSKGLRGVFDKEAVCVEETAGDFFGEFRRKSRIVNRSLRAVMRVPAVLNPLHVGRFALHLFAHKVLRWFVPFFLLLALLSNIGLTITGSSFYLVTLSLQLAFYGFALLGLVPRLKEWRPVYIASYFCLVNAAALCGVVECLFGRTVAVWNPERSGKGPEEVELGDASTSLAEATVETRQ